MDGAPIRKLCRYFEEVGREMREAPRQTPRQNLTAPIRRVRFTNVALFFVFWTAAIGLRLFWLQVVRHGDFVERAAKQQQQTFEVAPRRGVLYDRNLRELAMTVSVDSVYAVPKELGENRENAAEILAKIVHLRSAGHVHLRAPDPGAFQRLAELCVGGAADRCGDGEPGSRDEPARGLSAEGVQAVLPEQ